MPWRSGPHRMVRLCCPSVSQAVRTWPKSISSNAIWYVQVGALVVGHVNALTLAHDRALAVYGDVRSATRSQYFMLAVMVAFTCFGLYLLSQANA